MKRILLSLTLIALAFGIVEAQTPQIVVQAASPEPARPAAGAATPVADPNSMQAALRLLQDLKTANDEMLKKQEATLKQLDELQKTASQIRIFSSRD